MVWVIGMILDPTGPGFSQMTKAGITATATYYYDLGILVQVANLLNRPADSKAYAQKAVAVKTAFNKKFFNQRDLKYDSASQTANAMALFMNLVEPQYKNAVTSALVNDISNRNNALTAGDIGYRYVLTFIGRRWQKRCDFRNEQPR
jgi:glycogen debranching enzyme